MGLGLLRLHSGHRQKSKSGAAAAALGEEHSHAVSARRSVPEIHVIDAARAGMLHLIYPSMETLTPSPLLITIISFDAKVIVPVSSIMVP